MNIENSANSVAVQGIRYEEIIELLSLACNWIKPETMSDLFKNYKSQHDQG